MKKAKLMSNLLLAAAIGFSSVACAANDKLAVKITPELGEVPVKHHGKKMVIRRDQDQKAVVNKMLGLTTVK